MAWSAEYKIELDKLMLEWHEAVQQSHRNQPPTWKSLIGTGKSPAVLINDEYKLKLMELKERYNVN